MTALARAAPETKVPKVAPHSFETLRDQAALQVERRATGRLDWHAIDVRRGARIRAPAAAFERRRDLRHRRRSVLGAGAGPALPLRPAAARGRGVALSAHLGARPQGRARDVRAVRRPGARAVGSPTRGCTSITTAPTRTRRSSSSWGPTRRAKTRSTICCGANVFINLHTVVRQGLRAGVDSYSLKEVEALAAFERRAHVQIGMDAVLAYEKWMRSRDDAMLASIADYNEEDCRATLALRDWLVARHPADKAWAEVVEPKEEREQDDGERDGVAATPDRRRGTRIAPMARRRAARVSPARSAAGVVVVLQASRPDDRSGAARRRRSDQRPRSRPARSRPKRTRSFIRCGFRRSSTSCRRTNNWWIPRPRSRRARSSRSTT